MKEKIRRWSRMMAFDGHILAGLFRDYRGFVLLLFLLSVPQALEWILTVRFSEYLTNEVFRITDDRFRGFLAGVALFLALLLGIRISGWVFDRVYNRYDKRVSIHANEVLIKMDEPTAYLDPVAEIEMYQNILDLGKDKMIFFISHRLGFARMADRIIVIEDGQIVEQGSHGALLGAGGKYAVMYETQRGWYTE